MIAMAGQNARDHLQLRMPGLAGVDQVASGLDGVGQSGSDSFTRALSGIIRRDPRQCPASGWAQARPATRDRKRRPFRKRAPHALPWPIIARWSSSRTLIDCKSRSRTNLPAASVGSHPAHSVHVPPRYPRVAQDALAGRCKRSTSSSSSPSIVLRTRMPLQPIAFR